MEQTAVFHVEFLMTADELAFQFELDDSDRLVHLLSKLQYPMTANAFTEDKTKALKSGMDDYLTKPLESEKLIRALSRYKHN